MTYGISRSVESDRRRRLRLHPRPTLNQLLKALHTRRNIDSTFRVNDKERFS